MLLCELFPPMLLATMLEQGYVSAQTIYPDGHLTIYNYTPKAAYSRLWNQVTTQCRGLIVDTSSGEIVARPFPKFYNHGEPEAPPIGMDELVMVTDKMDGSLGIYYHEPRHGPCIATRGSFSSAQATIGTAMIQYKYRDWVPADESYTPMFEIIYPGNRIVCNYGEQTSLVLLGAVHKDRGLPIGPEYAADLLGWGGEVTDTWPLMTFAEALALPPRPGKEGFVICTPTEKVKVKQADYIQLHKIVTGLSRRTVWESVDWDSALSPEEQFETFAADLPDEFHQWAEQKFNKMMDKHTRAKLLMMVEWDLIISDLPVEYTRKDFALAVKGNKNARYMFKLEDGLDIDSMVWQSLRPEGNTAMYGG